MKKARLVVSCLLLILCLSLSQSCHKKSLSYEFSNDGKILGDNSTSFNHICIYLSSNGEKIERRCPNGQYTVQYLRARKSNAGKVYYEISFDPTDQIAILFYNKNWSENINDYNDDLYGNLWTLREDLKAEDVHITNYDLVYKEERKWDSSDKVWMTADTYYPLIKNGSFTEEIVGYPQRGFSIDPTYVERIELRGNDK